MRTAQILIIGDEILSGRTRDTNSHFLAKALTVRGIRTERVVVLPDNKVLISQWLHQNHGFSDVVFVCGGIGGTPDDLTRLAVAEAMGVPLVRNTEAEKILLEYYKDRVNEDRMSMADLPKGCQLIKNSVTQAPGFKIKNIYVFAGIPKILYAMFEAIEHELSGGIPLNESELNLTVGEGEIASFMKVINREFPSLELGSYPTLEENRGYKTQLVFRAQNNEVVLQALERFKELCAEKKIAI